MTVLTLVGTKVNGGAGITGTEQSSANYQALLTNVGIAQSSLGTTSLGVITKLTTGFTIVDEGGSATNDVDICVIPPSA